MSIETEIAGLTAATTDLLSAINVRKATLDQKVADATTQADNSLSSAAASEASATASSTSAGQSAGSAAQALAIYGNTTVMQTAVAQAAAQASLAAGHAASASSVVQQDLSGVNAAALHRSPNAVTAMFVYDTSKDSDGGAWTEKCQHTSWYNEAINGKWLGAQASEAAARAVSGATTGDYFQLTTDGKFYKLNATSGTTEVFRGNKRDFPRLSAIVADGTSSGANRVVIYDLTEPGRPMWMAASANANIYNYYPFIPGVNGVLPTSIHAINSTVAIGFSGVADRYGYLRLAKFASDSMQTYSNGSNKVSSVGIAKRNTTEVGFPIEGAPAGSVAPGIVNGMVNSVAMTVLPDAPVDPVTGLKVPTIAVATAGGVSVIRHDGLVRNLNIANNSNVDIAFNGSVLYVAGVPGTSAGIFSTTDVSGATINAANYFATYGLLQFDATGVNEASSFEYSRSTKTLASRPSNRGLRFLRENPASGAKSVAARIDNMFNTGWKIGDTRRVYLADVDAGSVSGTELVTNGTFDTDLTGWTQGINAVQTWSLGRIRVEAASGTSQPFTSSQTITGLVVGRSYRLTATVESAAGNSGVYARVRSNIVGDIEAKQAGVPFTASRVFVASATSMILTVDVASTVAWGIAGDAAFADNISVKEVVADRSYKAQGASITGTLTKSAVASAAQLVAYSGFSAANYLQEPYGADLDFGTGEWSESAWVSIPTANAAAGIIASRAHASGAYITLGIDATNKLAATVSDGATTRTVTSTSAYNTATWIKVRVSYTTDGSLALLVNGVEVAVTRGAPLLTLNNASAVLTIGNSYALDAPFPGSIALLKFSATVPTPEQSVWMYEQEKQMFRDGAQVCLPDSGAVVDLTYDDATDKWIAVSATNESEWSGLVRTSVKAVPAGSFSKVAATSGVKLEARTTASPGVDITIPAYGLREELVKRAESAARLARGLTTFDYVGGFTTNTTTGSTNITSVAGLSYPVSAVGAQVTGAGIPAGTVITAVSGATAYLSKAATATGTAVQISFTDFILPVGYEAKAVIAAGALKQEGATKDYTRLFDGFKEVVRFGAAPGYTAWVQVQAVRSAA